MKRLNNVDLEKLEKFAVQIQAEPTKARRTQVIEGKWSSVEGPVQFSGAVKYEKGEMTFQVDNPTFMGGGGTLPGPMHYCFFGLASCYTGTFAAIAAGMGLELKQLSVLVEADINFSRVFGLGEAPIMEEIRVKLTVESNAPAEKIREAEKLALQRCPVVYTLTNVVKLSPTIEIKT